MNKHEVAKMISDRIDGVTIAQITDTVDTFFDVLADVLCTGESFNQKNFGTFRLVDRKARVGRNPQTGESVEIPATKALKVVVSNNLRNRFRNSK